ncbi:cytochrome C oxidase subunit IV family protein [Limibacter armeniacum]|uniref:cytochrome C oxidase subunit IV family protein n=1 Tax=Limibacter armeniacum TaxID=466084 RepID=UPI002FE5CC49
MANYDTTLSPEELKKKNVLHIWKVAGILAIITGIEFALAFMWPESIDRSILNVLFVLLTLVKAFYIVAEFMHLKHEMKSLIWSVLLPLAFLVWLLVALSKEGSAITEMIMQVMK